MHGGTVRFNPVQYSDQFYDENLQMLHWFIQQFAKLSSVYNH